MEMAAALRRCAVAILVGVLFSSCIFAQQIEDQGWPQKFKPMVESFSKNFQGQIGIYIEDLNSKKRFTYNATKTFYLASTIKFFVMVEIYKLIYSNRISWDDKVRISTSKYRDGAGYVNWMPKDDKITIKKLVEYMMMKSDNAATDILIDIAGISAIEDTARSLGVFDIGRLTTLLDVRKHVFRELDPLAGNLTALDYIELWKIRDFNAKLRLFSKLIGKPQQIFTPGQLASSFESYYEKGFNSASLLALAEPIKKLAQKEIINQKASEEMLDLMIRSKTGGNRIKKGLPKGWVFAHKTGTQFRRICDIGAAAHGHQAEPVERMAQYFTGAIDPQRIFDDGLAFPGDFPGCRPVIVDLVNVGVFHAVDGRHRVHTRTGGKAPAADGRSQQIQWLPAFPEPAAEQHPVQVTQNQPFRPTRGPGHHFDIVRAKSS